MKCKYINDASIHEIINASNLLRIKRNTVENAYPKEILPILVSTLKSIYNKYFEFQNTDRHIKYILKYPKCNPECESWIIHFSTVGIFSYTQIELFKKVLKPNFKLHKQIFQ